MSIGFLLSSLDDAVIWRGPKKNGLIKQFLRDVDWSDLEYLLIDTPPGTSDEHLTIVEYLKPSGITGALIITTPQEVSLLDVRKEITFCQRVNVPILGVIENMSGFVCPKCRVSIFLSSTKIKKKILFKNQTNIKDWIANIWGDEWWRRENVRRNERAILGQNTARSTHRQVLWRR